VGKRVSQAQLLGMVSELGGEFGGFDAGEKEVLLGAMGVAAGSFDAFSRDDETESDIVGLRYMIEAGYEPEAAVRFWEKMAALGGSGGLEFLSTHPSSERRVENLRRAIRIYREGGDPWKFEHYSWLEGPARGSQPSSSCAALSFTVSSTTSRPAASWTVST
jgi:predicted Zn-dependent protease